MRVSFAAAAAVALATVALARAGDTVHVQLTKHALCDPLPSDFVSFSIETMSMQPTLTFPPGSSTPRPSWINLMNNLRSAVNGGNTGKGPNIRVGGNSADTSVYLPGTAPLPTNDTYRLTPTDFGEAGGAREGEGCRDLV